MTCSETTGAELRALQIENKKLRSELEFLKTHPVFVQGVKGETILLKLAGGELSEFAAEHDLTTSGDIRIEIKFSKLNTPAPGKNTRRWNWSKPLGYLDKGKNYDFLVLVGDKDSRYPDQYLDSSPYVFFLIPRNKVTELMSSGSSIGGSMQLGTNFDTLRSPRTLGILAHMVDADKITKILGDI